MNLRDSEPDGSFEIGPNGRPINNAYFPCYSCGEPVGVVLLYGDRDQIADDPTIRHWCEACFFAHEVDAIIEATTEEGT